ncbi:OprO/OprP family phosphate-selective porin [Zavarzinia sp. CC-PAN008]|uniref:OprO/OprP family phosphate-selective porin n=1 Tax=Zavarzinia sp. CC-PAN008 TaxID=3243332 RepID=UPI003F744180
MRSNVRLLAGTACTLLALAMPANAQSVNDLQAQINALQDQLQDLKIKLNAQTQQIQQQAATQPSITLTNGRPTFKSADGQFELYLTGRVHYDMASYMQDDRNGFTDQRPAGVQDLNSGFNFRRVRVGMGGKLWKDWEFLIQYDLGGSVDNTAAIDEAQLSYTGLKPVTLTIGAFKPGGPMEDRVSSNDITFMERASAVNLASSLAAGTARYAVGARANGDRFYASAYLTGSTPGTGTAASDDEQTGATIQGAVLALKDKEYNLHLGANASYVFNPTSDNSLTPGSRTGFRLRDRPELRVDDNRLVDTGSFNIDDAWHWGLEVAGNYRNFLVQAEYLNYGFSEDRPFPAANADPTFEGYYVSGSWMITGEQRRYSTSRGAYGAPKVEAPFMLDGSGWGAWELAVRYSFVDLNDGDTAGVACGPNSATGCVRGGEQEVYTFGLNWYANANVRFMLNYLVVHVDRLNNAGTLSIGDDYQAIGLRTQVAF